MAVDTNGHSKASNGSTHMNGKMNGTANGSSRKTTVKRRGFFAALFSIVARLSTWAAILTILFRCPSSLEACDETSPYICKPYFQAKQAILPHATPYYERYAAPYIDVARPYYNTVDQVVITPTRKYAVQYGGPWIEKAQQQALAQWQQNGEPRLNQLREASLAQYEEKAAPLINQAQEAVGPYYEIASTNGVKAYNDYVLPGYRFAEPYALQGYNAASDFAVHSALPAAYWTWNKTNAFLDTTVWPQLRVVYVQNVEPQLVRIGERLGRYKNKTQQTVNSVKEAIPEPSEAKESIESAFAKSSINEQTTESQTIQSETTKPKATEPAASEAPKQPSVQEDDEYFHPVQAPPAGENDSDRRKAAREIVVQDLAMWQDKFAALADEGAVEIEERVGEIAERMVAEHVQTTGKSLSSNLANTVEEEIETLKAKIIEIVAESRSEEEVTLAVRAAGLAIKEKAKALRTWRESFDADLQKAVIEAADHHFKILESTRSMALQKIGMKWAWTEGITYKDWAKFHELKSTLNEWTDQLKDLIVSNPGLLQAQEAAAKVEDEGMDVAGSAASRLVELKDVAHYKIVAQDATENFEKEAMIAAAEAAIAAKEAQRVAEESARASAAAASKAAEESASAAASQASEAAARASEEASREAAEAASKAKELADEQSTAASQSVESVLSEGEEATSEAAEELSSTVENVQSSASSVVEDVASEASAYVSQGTESVKSVVDDASEAVEDATIAAQNSAHSVADAAQEAASDAYDSASSAVEDTASTVSEAVESASDEAKDDAAEAESAATAFASQASEAIIGNTDNIVANVSGESGSDSQEQTEKEVPEEVEEDPLAARDETPSDADDAPVKPAFLGAMAQAVPERQVVLDDYVDTDAVEDTVESWKNAASEAYSNAVSKASDQYSSAASIVSAQIYGTPKPVHEQLFASVSNAYDQALAAASSKYDQAVGTPTPTSNPAMVDWKRVEDIASQRLNEGKMWAEVQYQSAIIALGLATATPTPSSVSEKYLEQAKKNYFAGVGVAQERYSSFLSAASSAMSSMTATPTPTTTDFLGGASAAFDAARESAESIAKLAEEAVEGAWAQASEGVEKAASAVEDQISGAIDGAAEQAYLAGQAIAETWEQALAQISGQVYGEQKYLGWYDSLFEEASKAGDAASEAASQVTEKAGDSAATASAEAAKQYDAVKDLVDELIHGKEPTFSESVLSRLSAAYATAAAGVESYASEASEAAKSVGDKVADAASQATEAVKEKFEDTKDEL